MPARTAMRKPATPRGDAASWLLLALLAVACACQRPSEPVEPRPSVEVHRAELPVASPRWLTYFNEPSQDNGFSDDTLRDQLVALIDGAVPGSEIRAHVTRLSGADSMRAVPDALANAHERGVAIEMVHDGGSFVFPRLQELLGDRYVHCGTPEVVNNTGCLSRVANGTHHMKNWYFSRVELDGELHEHVVTTSSYNITVTQSRYFNDMLVISGDRALYEEHVAIFDDYLHQRKTDDRHREPGGRIFVPSAATFTADFSPQKRGDMVADALRKIHEHEEGCSLRVANLNLTRSAIIRQLIRVRALGCEVRVATGTPLTEAAERRLRRGGVETRNVAFEHEGRDVGLHNKMMVYRGHYDSPVDTQPRRDRRWVWTGSQNFTARPLRFRDDVFVGLSHRGVYEDYRRHFETLWEAGE